MDRRYFTVILVKTTSWYDAIKRGGYLALSSTLTLRLSWTAGASCFAATPAVTTLRGLCRSWQLIVFLQQIRHWPRHDLESFFWLTLLFTSRHHEGQVVDDPPFQEWYQCSAKLLAHAKSHFLYKGRYRPTLHFTRLRRAWVTPLEKIINGGSMSLKSILDETEAVQATYSYETLGGFITHETFLAILRAEIPPQSFTLVRIVCTSQH